MHRVCTNKVDKVLLPSPDQFNGLYMNTLTFCWYVFVYLQIIDNKWMCGSLREEEKKNRTLNYSVMMVNAEELTWFWTILNAIHKSLRCCKTIKWLCQMYGWMDSSVYCKFNCLGCKRWQRYKMNQLIQFAAYKRNKKQQRTLLLS